jgi:hypothetical protein
MDARRGLLVLAALACASSTAPAAATPVAGKSVDVAPTELGKKSSVKCPGEAGFTRIDARRQIPLGCEVDMTDSELTITSARADGTPQTGEFRGNAHFRLTQDGDFAVLTFVPPFSCRALGNRLFADVQGLFRSVGRYGSGGGASVWRMSDGCDITTDFTADEGTLEVRDFPARKTVQLRAGRSYTAGAQRGCANLLVMPPRSDYAAINITVSGIKCAAAKPVLLAWMKRLPRYKGSKTKPFPTKSGGWTFDSGGVDDDRSQATRGVASLSFKLISTFFARP